jgi:RNA polymerase sigma factor (TIGR02999 family)
MGELEYEKTPTEKNRNPDQLADLLDAFKAGDSKAAARIWDIIYVEVHQMASAQLARERSDIQLQPTLIVHEVFMRIWPGGVKRLPTWQTRGQMFSNIARVMGQFLIDHARNRNRLKRGGGRSRIPFEFAEGELARFEEDRFDENQRAFDALVRLEAHSPRSAEVAWLRFVVGLNIMQTSVALEISERSVVSDWQYARAWLKSELAKADETEED